MRLWILRTTSLLVLAAATWLFAPTDSNTASAFHGNRETIRFQQPHDIYYNYYVGGSGRPAAMYVSPLPVPAHVGHTYNSYPALYPHELMYQHHRSWYSYHRGAGWSRTKAYYSTRGSLMDTFSHMRRF